MRKSGSERGTMASSYILTFDLGTTSNKCTLFTETGAEFGSVAVPYLTRYPHPGWAEQDPAELWASVVRGSRALLADAPALAGEIAAIGLSGHMNGCLAVDSSGEPVYADIIHSDGRSAREAEEIREKCGLEAFYQLTGNRPDSHFSLPKILWLRNNVPEAYDRAAFFLNCKDYIAFKLTGKLGFTDFSDASLTTAMDIRKKTW
jgi:xylulokinase